MCACVWVDDVCMCVCVNEVKGIMKDNINRVAEKGDRLEDLQDKSGKRVCVCVCVCVLRERVCVCMCVCR